MASSSHSPPLEPVSRSATASNVSHSTGHELALLNVTHKFGDIRAVSQVNLQINPGEFVTLLGPSGCGKTTLLKLIAGFLMPTAGRILIDGQSVEQVPPHKREVGIVFQNYALFPHMTAWENVAYGLRARRSNKALIASRVDEMLTLVQLYKLGKRYPSELSGGQQQRIALARALAVQPRILLLDEPFSALDKNLRLDMQIEVKQLLTERGITTIFVTHDQAEALSMADRIAVIRSGIVEQVDTPSNIYDRPSTVFVSTFVGTSNLLPGRLVHVDSRGCAVKLEGAGVLRLAVEPPASVGEAVRVAVRPENLCVHFESGRDRLEATVAVCMPLGASTIYEVQAAGGAAIKVTQPRTAGTPVLHKGQQIYLSLASPHACSIFPA